MTPSFLSTLDPMADDPMQDTIFISGLPDDVSEEELAVHFGMIGVVKVYPFET